MKKAQVIDLVKTLPEEFTIDDLVEKLYIIQIIEEASKEVDEGKVMTEEEARKKLMERWQK